MTMQTLDVEFQFKKLEDQGHDEVYDVWLYDQTRSASELHSRIESIRITPSQPIPKLGMSPESFIHSFRNRQE